MSQTRHAITWFEIPVHELDRAQRLYEAVLERPMKREAMGSEQMALFAADAEGVQGCLNLGAEAVAPSAAGTRVYLDATNGCWCCGRPPSHAARCGCATRTSRAPRASAPCARSASSSGTRCGRLRPAGGTRQSVAQGWGLHEWMSSLVSIAIAGLARPLKTSVRPD